MARERKRYARIDTFFTTVEDYDNMTAEQLQFSKFAKLIHHITVLDNNEIPRNTEFRCKERVDALWKKWQEILNTSKSTSTTN
ncbi:hypothetical protein AN958_07078 [Leucoagaricus sp. SymC.cos]|nr:hypothetical protein AN958_07078 [Leucoagaricus sp. SymC.cos]